MKLKIKLIFMKGVVDFTYPEIILFKIHLENHSTKSFKLLFQKNNEILTIMNMNKTLNLSKS